MAPKKGSVTMGDILFKQYPGQQQVELSVVIETPGSWFSGTSEGQLNAIARRPQAPPNPLVCNE